VLHVSCLSMPCWVVTEQGTFLCALEDVHSSFIFTHAVFVLDSLALALHPTGMWCCTNGTATTPTPSTGWWPSSQVDTPGGASARRMPLVRHWTTLTRWGTYFVAVCLRRAARVGGWVGRGAAFAAACLSLRLLPNLACPAVCIYGRGIPR